MFNFYLILFLFSNFLLWFGDTKISPIEIYENTKFENSDSYCLSSLTQDDCATDEIIISQGTEFGCPICTSKGKKVKDMCSSINNEYCQFGLRCNDDNICDLDRSTCAYTYHLNKLSEDEAQINPSKLPTCEIDGTFAAVQCKGDRVTGRCFCYNSDGKRIYGWAWWHELHDKKIACACSRLKYKMEREGFHGNTIHCDTMGNFEELQCNEGVCWCADKLTGEMQNKTRAVPEKMWKFLPCYDSKYHGEQYLRQCESVANAQSLLKKALYIHGTTHVEFNNIMCDYDGSHGLVKNMDGKIYCQWTDGKNIGSFASESKQISDMGCLCARDQKIFQLNGLSHRMTCNGLGNYDSNQNINGKEFCVDNDGFAVNEAIETKDIIDCKKYTYYKVEVKPNDYIEYGEGEDYSDNGLYPDPDYNLYYD